MYSFTCSMVNGLIYNLGKAGLKLLQHIIVFIKHMEYNMSTLQKYSVVGKIRKQVDILFITNVVHKFFLNYFAACNTYDIIRHQINKGLWYVNHIISNICMIRQVPNIFTYLIVFSYSLHVDVPNLFNNAMTSDTICLADFHTSVHKQFGVVIVLFRILRAALLNSL